MTEELLKQKFGRENHFKVPEGFFDNFAADFMQQLPEEETKAVEVKMTVAKRPWYKPMRTFAIAASFAALLFGAATYYASTGIDRNNEFDSSGQTAKAGIVSEPKSTSVSTEYMIDEMADYAMMDNSEIYRYLLEN